MKKKINFKNDTYRRVRGGYSRFLEISCEKCGTFICGYQKDGPGILKRMYVDRIHGFKKVNFRTNLVCPSCKEVLGTPIMYKKEKREAYRLFVGAVVKRITKIS